jgi:hypothetical protein
MTEETVGAGVVVVVVVVGVGVVGVVVLPHAPRLTVKAVALLSIATH